MVFVTQIAVEDLPFTRFQAGDAGGEDDGGAIEMALGGAGGDMENHQHGTGRKGFRG